MRKICLHFLSEEKSLSRQLNYADHSHYLHAGKDAAKRLTLFVLRSDFLC